MPRGWMGSQRTALVYRPTPVNTMFDFPTVTLKSGLVVANFSSPHPFTFTDGSVLAACSSEHARALMLTPIEIERPSPCGRFTDIELTFEMSPDVLRALVAVNRLDSVDVVLVPLPVMKAMSPGTCPKARTVRVADRVAKVIHHDRFCVA